MLSPAQLGLHRSLAPALITQELSQARLWEFGLRVIRAGAKLLWSPGGPLLNWDRSQIPPEAGPG